TIDRDRNAVIEVTDQPLAGGKMEIVQNVYFPGHTGVANLYFYSAPGDDEATSAWQRVLDSAKFNPGIYYADEGALAGANYRGYYFFVAVGLVVVAWIAAIAWLRRRLRRGATD